MIIGTLMALETCLTLGTGFTQFTLLDEKAPDGLYLVRGEIDEKAAYIQARSIYGQSYGSQWERMPS